MNALATEHLADLKRSGLSESTIAALHFEAVRPHDLKQLRGVESAYTIPYFSIDGAINGFARRKLFPPVKTNTGTMRYWQPPDTRPHLYCPPLVNWQTVAKNAKTEVIVTEGEKKAAAGCQQGLVVAGIGGVWCWRSTLDNGDKLVLPMLDEFRWTPRPVLLCPDSDAWHEDKEMNILSGFFALAKELQQRGAAVQFVRLPDLHGRKAGLDDWLCMPGNNIEHGWPKLERIALDDDRFSSLTSWWQSWKEKQATADSFNTQPVDVLDLQELAGLHTVTFPAHHVRFLFERLSDARGGVQAELTIMAGQTELLGATDISLKTDSSRSKIAGSLKGLAASIPWKPFSFTTGPPLTIRACSISSGGPTASGSPGVTSRAT